MRYSSYAKKTYNSGLQRASVNDEHFSLLIEISPIRSKKNIMALKEYLVDGYSKQESCERNNVSISYFCLCLKKLNYTHSIVSALKYFYRE
ncbi:TPA: transcriptional regulator [Escherichia coli]|nr:transcriptional regulator [Escherichia coli]